MKTFRYMLIAVAMLSAMSIEAHMFDKTWGQQPIAEMHSTSTMAYSGSTLPQAAATGVKMASVADVESSTSTRPYHPGRIRRASDEEEGDTPPVNPHGPNEDPLGDVLWPLMLMALAYMVYLKTRKKKENI